MRKTVLTIAALALLSTTISVPAFADGWGRHYHEMSVGDALLWPITAALTLPAAVVETVAHATIPPVLFDSAPTAVVESPAAYAGPRAYYAPEPYYAPRVYVAPRAYYGPRGYYVSRGYYPGRGYYRVYRDRW